jgi:hypothetical protein
MTAKTAASHCGPAICDNPVRALSEDGEVADAYTPGTVVYESAAGIWTAVTTSVGNLNRVGVLGFKPRVVAGVAKTIDDAYTAGDARIPVYGTGVVTVKITDQGASLLRGVKLMYSTTAGALTVMAATEQCLATVEVAVADNDLYAKVRLEGAGWVV